MIGKEPVNYIQEAPVLTLEEQLAKLSKLPLDDFSKLVVQGALRVVADAENPIRLNLSAAAIRELYSHTLHRLAPNAEVQACKWFKFEKGQDKPTRKQRAKYATQGGLPDHLIEEAGVDVKHLHDEAIAAIDNLSKYTHVRPGTVVSDQSEIETFVREALGALIGLFESFDKCRDCIEYAILEYMDEEVTSALLSETILTLDEFASHTQNNTEEIWVGDIKVMGTVRETKIMGITHEAVNFVVTGTVEVGLQWDRWGEDGFELYHSFPFRTTMWSPVDDITCFKDVEHSVDTSSWWESYYDEKA
jgi:hypothetical protein